VNAGPVLGGSRWVLGRACCSRVTERERGLLLKRLYLAAVVGVVSALVMAGSALAVTVPTVPVSDYGDSILSGLVTQLTAIFPYAAAITVFAIGVGMVRRWLGHRKATKI